MTLIPEVCQIEECELQRSFIELLPSGPLWDMDKFETACGDPCINTANAPSMALYAAYTGSRLYDVVSNVLWPVFRENSPETAVTTLDDWLIRLGWDGCLNAPDFCCSPPINPGTLISISGQDGFVHDHPVYTPEYRAAIRRAIIRSLWRMRNVGIRNLEYINWVLEPLGARVIADPNIPEGQCNCGDSSYCLVVVRLTDYIEGVPSKDCGSAPSTPIISEIDGVWPNLWAAQMIVMSLALPGCRTCVEREDTYVPPVAPVNIELPELECGDFRIVATRGVWESELPIFYTLEWLRNGVVVPGVIGLTYDITPADIGADIQLRVTAENLIGFTVALSNICSVSDVPQLVNSPIVVPSCPVMMVDSLVWSDTPASVEYQWSVDGVEVSGATSAVYAIREEDKGKTATVAVTACNIRGCSTYEVPGAIVPNCQGVFGFCEGFSGFCGGAEWDC